MKSVSGSPAYNPGDPLRAAERFWPKAARAGAEECWPWLANKNPKGYGLFWYGGTFVVAHRWSYVFEVGEIPDGLVIDHLCRNRACVNPAHLEPVSGGENVRRGDHQMRRKTHCPQGHEYTRANTYHAPGTTHRGCVTCRLEANRRHREAKRAECEQGAEGGEGPRGASS